MEFVRAGVFALGVLLALTATGWAHFQVITPSTDTVTDQTGGKIEIALLFTHPMGRGPVMQMEKPVRFGVKTAGAITDLAGELRPTTVAASRPGKLRTTSNSRPITSSSSSRSRIGSPPKRK
jgi:nickel transport protein